MAPPPVDLQPGLDLQSDVWRRFHLPVSFSSDHSQLEFFLVASFGRCKFRLDPLVMGFLLQSAIGGSTKDFNVHSLSDRVFRFSVSGKQVGFFIYNLRFFKSLDFIVYFHLWNGGGPNWQKEFSDFSSEEDGSWQLVSKKKLSYADAIKKPGVVLTGLMPLRSRTRKSGGLAFLFLIGWRILNVLSPGSQSLISCILSSRLFISEEQGGAV
jgi:hypothetical protein